MKRFEDFLETINNQNQKERVREVLDWIKHKYPNLLPQIKYNQPMFTDHGTFIIGFSISKNHLAVAPEEKTINYFSKEIVKSGYDFTTNMIRIPWKSDVDYKLLEGIINFNIIDKQDIKAFWRK